jgi:NTE family protein
LLNNLPVEPLLDQGIAVVGVHCNPVNAAARITSFRSLVERTLLLGINANTPARRLRCDLVIEPPELRHFRTLSYRRATELFDIGYRHTLSLAPQLRALQ